MQKETERGGRAGAQAFEAAERRIPFRAQLRLVTLWARGARVVDDEAEVAEAAATEGLAAGAVPVAGCGCSSARSPCESWERSMLTRGQADRGGWTSTSEPTTRLWRRRACVAGGDEAGVVGEAQARRAGRRET